MGIVVGNKKKWELHWFWIIGYNYECITDADLIMIFVLHLAWCLSNAFSDSIVYTSPTIHYDDHGDSDDDGWCINL